MAKNNQKNKPKYSNIEEIDIDLIIHRENYRKTIDENEIQELANSMVSVGLPGPILVVAKGSKYQLIYGQRRLLAAILLGWKTIDSRIATNIKGEKLVELQLIENIQRKSPHALDECETFLQLVKITTVEEIAANIGVTEQYVHDRLHLKNLAAEVKRLFKDGHISLSHCLQFAKLQTTKQIELLERIKYNVAYNDGDGEHRFAYRSVKEMRKIIEKEFVIQLSKATFDVEDRSLVRKCGACTACMKRSGTNRTLFGDVQAEDLCFDTKCFWLKTNHRILKIEKQYLDAGNKVIRLDTALIANDTEFEDLVSMTEVHQIPDSEIDNVESNTYGIIFASESMQLLGTAIKLYETPPVANETLEAFMEAGKTTTAVEPKVTPSQRRINNVKISNARLFLKNTFKEKLAFNIGKNEFTKIPVAILKLMIYNLIINNDTLDIILGLRWLYDGAEIDVDFYQDIDDAISMEIVEENTANMEYVDLIRMLLIFTIHNTLENSEVYEATFQPIFEIAKEFGIDTDELIKETAKEFSIDADKITNEV